MGKGKKRKTAQSTGDNPSAGGQESDKVKAENKPAVQEQICALEKTTKKRKNEDQGDLVKEQPPKKKEKTANKPTVLHYYIIKTDTNANVQQNNVKETLGNPSAQTEIKTDTNANVQQNNTPKKKKKKKKGKKKSGVQNNVEKTDTNANEQQNKEKGVLGSPPKQAKNMKKNNQKKPVVQYCLEKTDTDANVKLNNVRGILGAPPKHLEMINFNNFPMKNFGQNRTNQNWNANRQNMNGPPVFIPTPVQGADVGNSNTSHIPQLSKKKNHQHRKRSTSVNQKDNSVSSGKEKVPKVSKKNSNQTISSKPSRKKSLKGSKRKKNSDTKGKEPEPKVTKKDKTPYEMACETAFEGSNISDIEGYAIAFESEAQKQANFKRCQV